MEYKPNHMVQEFAKRTQKNLSYITTSRVSYNRDVYEVTQLINSLLGLIIFPQQNPDIALPNDNLADLDFRWPEQVRALANPLGTYKNLMRCMRNAIAHCNFEFVTTNEVVVAIEIRATCDLSGVPTRWGLRLSIEELRRFIDLSCELWTAKAGNSNFSNR